MEKKIILSETELNWVVSAVAEKMYKWWWYKKEKPSNQEIYHLVKTEIDAEIDRSNNITVDELLKKQREICSEVYQPKIGNLPKHSEAYKILNAIKLRILNAPSPNES